MTDKERSKIYYLKNKKQILKRHKKWREENKDYIHKKYLENKEQIRKYNKLYNQTNKEKIKQKNREYRKKNREEINLKAKKYREENKELLKIKRLKKKDELIEKSRLYREKNREVINRKAREKYHNNKEFREKHAQKHKEFIEKNPAYSSNYDKERGLTDISYKMRKNLKNRINQALNGKTKSLSTMFLIGCCVDYLMYHLQSQFTEGMSWDNYGFGKGKWVIDHILPCASFDLSKPEEQQKCFHYTNLQPLWFEKNLEKGFKIL